MNERNRIFESLVSDTEKRIQESKARSAWNKGVKIYALEILENVKEYVKENGSILEIKSLYEIALCGASSWYEYSSGGCALIYNGDIAERLCTKSELVSTEYGAYNPNNSETWIDVQERALTQAWNLLARSWAAAEDASMYTDIA